MYLACRVKVGLKKIFTNQFQPLITYFYCTKILQILYSTYYKPNGSINVLKMKDKKLPIYFFVFL